MEKLFIFLFSSIISWGCSAQVPATRPQCQNPDFDKRITQWLNFSVKTISPAEAANIPNAVFLDAREREEYDVSHLPNALFIGYKQFKTDVVAHLDKNIPIVVYCSIGYRSEKIGERLQKLGFKHVHNLYGSIFEWVNTGRKVVTTQGDTTQRVHTFNKAWSRWIDNKSIEKVW
jgi:rhodanese-related sulfurtransferase